MEQVGATLRRMREEKGLTVEDVARMTRIRAEILQQIESGDYHQISEGPFLRGFIRSYAQSLGKSEQETENLLGLIRPGKVETGKQPSPERQADQRLWYGVGGLAAVALVVALLLANRGHDKAPSPSPLPPPISEVKPPVEATPPPEVNPPSPALPPQPEPPAVASAVPPPPPAPTTGAVHLEIRALEPCWISVGLDQEPYQSMLLTAGETRAWDAKKGGYLTLGNAGGVVVLVNGREYAKLGDSGKVLRAIQVTAQGLRIPKEQAND